MKTQTYPAQQAFIAAGLKSASQARERNEYVTADAVIAKLENRLALALRKFATAFGDAERTVT